ncbi:SnoaL-like protein [Flavobacterium araucananum]|uniref:Bile acid 7-alpha-dehydratase n=1 Tax=Flavobacterium araucananum TaxID=946678 RepID=A0A227PCS6_9FLAO|nr:nuclear transport factor 2 family protein [Flavobacterium araucananum]OXG07078.1 bile acid 7-alpha-dehydratase [Flavobacterium araucananum]PWJ97506.1 SnoaL-like protein [Flavobacterium araucananum]
MPIKDLADKILLKELIDNISIYGDKKDFDKQVQLFSSDAISETFMNGKSLLKLKGRIEMKAAFAEFLKDYDVVYHFNGQQKLTINQDKATATGVIYCLITLIGIENHKKIKTSIGATYQDEYVFENGQWLIAKRIGNFEWQDKIEVV